MSINEQLSLLSIAGLVIAFISGLIPQFAVTTREKGLRKFQTPAGRAALVVSALSLLVSLSSELLRAYLARQEAHLRLEEEAAAARDLQEQRRSARESAGEQRRWQQRSDALAAVILRNTASQLAASERSMAEMLRGFQAEQVRQRQTVAEIQTAARRNLLRLGTPSFTVSAAFNCRSATPSPFCRQAARGGAAGSIDPPAQEPISFTVYFAIPERGQAVTVSGSMIVGRVDLFGRLRLSSAQARPRLNMTLHDDVLRIGSVRARIEDIPPAISQELSSLVDLAGRTVLVWGRDLARAERLRFAIDSESNYSLSADCSRIGTADIPDFSIRDASETSAFACRLSEEIF